MSATLVTVTKNTRGRDSREVSYKAIGKYVSRTIARETDEEGKPLPKDENGKQITRDEVVEEFDSNGVLTDVADVRALLPAGESGDRIFLDIVADGYNEWAFAQESNRDELTPFISHLNDDQQATIRRAVNAMAKVEMFKDKPKVDILQMMLKNAA